MLATVLALGCYCIGWWVRQWGVVGGYGLLGQLRPSDGCNWGLGSGSLGSQGPREASRTRALAPGKQIDRGEQKGHSQNLYNLWNKFLTGRIEETSTVERYILLSNRAQHVKNVHSPKFNKEICRAGFMIENRVNKWESVQFGLNCTCFEKSPVVRLLLLFVHSFLPLTFTSQNHIIPPHLKL